MTFWLILGTLLAAPSEASHADSAALAAQIDRRLAERFRAESVVLAERAGDTEFLRRVSLDLVGRVPVPEEIRSFLADARPDKRACLIDELLADPAHARHFARVWRALLLPEAETEPQIRYFQPGFEAWLQARRRDNTGFDKLVTELLTVPIARPDETPQFVLRDLRQPNPLAFIAAKNAEPDKIASSSVRLFLGLRLECAQCHDHPFDHWTRRQFWNQAAFFAGLERRGKGIFAPLVEATERRSVPLMNGPEAVPALFLDLSEPQIDDRQSARVRFAEWMTSPDNPFFARAVVNRIWAQLMGTGIVEPVDDFRDANAASHPELLDDLTGAFRASSFDMTVLLRAICLTDAYQRTSRMTHDSQARPETFARMAIKPLSGEQFFDSLVRAIACTPPEDRSRDEDDDDPLRRGVLTLFAQPVQSGDPETSVAQALTLMNGSLIQRAVVLETGARLQRILEEYPTSAERQFEELYLATFSRFPTPAEREVLLGYYQDGDKTDQTRRLGDIFWMLLNSAEFRWNH